MINNCSRIEDITTKIEKIMNLREYINIPKCNDKEIWLKDLPNDRDLFDIIKKLHIYYDKHKFTFVIDQSIKIKGIIIDKDVDFSNCIFKDNISFSNSTFKLNVDFSNCIFELPSLFDDISFEGSVIFKGSFFEYAIFKSVTFTNKERCIDFSYSFFYNASFYSLKFKTDVTFEHSTFKYSFLKYFSFHSCVFENKVYFFAIKLVPDKENYQNILLPPLQFIKTEFKNDVYFNEANYIGDVFFSDCIFGQNNIEKSISYIDFTKAKFNQNVKFSSSIFNSKIILKNTNFKDLLYFHKVDFYQPTQFLFTDFREKVFFANTHFFEEVQFLYCNVESSSFIRFECSTFEKCLEISRSNFDYCKLRFWDIQIKGENKINEYINYKNDFGETLIEPSVYSKIRESFRFIKSTFYAENNKIEGLRFYEKEMSVYLEEKRNKKDNSENYSFKKKEVNDCLLLKKCLTNKFINRLFTLLLILLYLPFCMLIILLSPIYITAILIHKITNIETKNTLHFIINFIFLGLYIFTKDLIWYIFFAPHFLYSILYSVPNLKRSISYSIKENNYISLIILFICLVSILVAVYGIPNQNNYILLWEGKVLSFNNNILTFISYISLIIIALLFVIIFKKNEKILLWFNKNSNNFGTNWFIGLNFTTLVALITYVVISLLSSNVILQFDAEGVGNFLKGLVKIINVTEWNDITFLGQELTNWQYILLFIGRIFIGYGYYQTIQAFRKFGKS